jgi:hypothetical protein
MAQGRSLAIYEKNDMVVRKWNFRQYVSPYPNERPAIDDWRKKLPQGPFKTDLDQFLRTLAKMATWPSGHLDSLKGKQNKGLTELRWTSGKIEHRIIGYQIADSGDRSCYLMLLGCTHKGRVYTPAEAISTAQDRRNLIQTGRATTSEYLLVSDSGTPR